MEVRYDMIRISQTCRFSLHIRSRSDDACRAKRAMLPTASRFSCLQPSIIIVAVEFTGLEDEGRAESDRNNKDPSPSKDNQVGLFARARLAPNSDGVPIRKIDRQPDLNQAIKRHHEWEAGSTRKRHESAEIARTGAKRQFECVRPGPCNANVSHTKGKTRQCPMFVRSTISSMLIHCRKQTDDEAGQDRCEGAY